MLEFTYDGESRLVRIVERDKGQVVADHAWTWCGAERCLERDNLQDGSPVTKRTFAQGFIADGTGYYTVTDPLGSVRQVLDAEGKVQAEYDYTPWGYRFQKTGDGSVTSDIGFAGYFHHASSSYDFALYRAYDSMHRRWLNRDPIGEAGGMNLYGYVDANPTSTSDPSGLLTLVMQNLFAILNDRPPPIPMEDAVRLDKALNAIEMLGTGAAAAPAAIGVIGSGLTPAASSAAGLACEAASTIDPAELARVLLFGASVMRTEFRPNAIVRLVIDPEPQMVQDVLHLEKIAEESSLANEATRLNPTTVPRGLPPSAAH